MSLPQKTYTRIGDRGKRTREGTYSLWLASDHLLNVCSNSFVEEYRRFYLEDLEAIILRKSNSYLIRTIILVLLIGASFIFLLAESNAAIWVSTGLAAFFSLILFFHIRKGSSCVCHFKTAVQIQMIPSLTRYRDVEKLVQKIKSHLKPNK